MKGHGSQFQRKMGLAVSAVLSHRNTEEAARAVGISSKALLRWEKTVEFQAALREAGREARDQAISRMQCALPILAAILIRLAADPGTPPADRIRAIQMAFQESNNAAAQEVEARVTALERYEEQHSPEPVSSGPTRRNPVPGSLLRFPEGQRGPRTNGHGSQFHRKMDIAVAAVMSHRNTEEAARAVGINSKTLLRWQKTQEFQAALREACRQARDLAVVRLQCALPILAAILIKLAADASIRATTRVRAIQTAFQESDKATAQELETRIRELERHTEQNKRGTSLAA